MRSGPVQASLGRSEYLVLITVLWLSLSATSLSDPDPDTDFQCPPDLFRCGKEMSPGRRCISHGWVCDGEQDCPDGLDEEQNCPPATCSPDQFECLDKKRCIPTGWQCDGEPDCKDGSDEAPKVCLERESRYPPNQYRCDGTKISIYYSQLCDSVRDCPDGEDEGIHCRTSGCSSSTCLDSDAVCKIGPSSSFCDCGNQKYYNTTTKQCTDLNECSYDGHCDQICTNKDPGYECSCQPGYVATNKSACIAVNEPKGAPGLLLYADSDFICKMVLGETPSNCTWHINAPRSKTGSTFDFNFNNKSICYIMDSLKTVGPGNDRVVICASIDNTTSMWAIPFVYSVTSVEQMAYDWVSINWYFTDESHEKIFACRHDGAFCVTLISVGIKGPKGITLDPLQGYLFFSTLGEVPRIMRASLDGSDVKTLVGVQRIVRPQALTVDLANQHLYWADSYLDRLERVNYDGSNRQLILKKMWVEKAFGLAVHENFIYLTSERNRSMFRIHRLDDPKHEKKILTNFTRTPPGQIRIYHRTSQPKGSDVCAKAGCEQMCITMNSRNLPTPQCVCEAGKKLGPNGVSCVSAIEEVFLIYTNAKLGEIKGISAKPGVSHEVMPPITGLGRPVAIDYHRSTQYIYYSDANSFGIGRRKVDGTLRDDSFIKHGINNCEGLAVDWIAENLYWTDEGKKTVSVAKLANATIKKTLISGGLSNPRAIVVDPYEGYIFWTDWVQRPSMTPAKIERANLDGSNRVVLVNQTIQWPNGLTIDHSTKRLFWCDAYTDRLESISYDGTNRKHLTNSTKTPKPHTKPDVRHPYGFTYHDDRTAQKKYLYWTEFTDGHIKRTTLDDKGLASGEVILRNESIPLFEIKLFHNSSQKGQNPCGTDNGGCEGLCLYRGDRTKDRVVCACRDGYKINRDGKTCSKNGSSNATSGENECESFEFKCKNGRCINKQWKCDGDNDCGDNTDEDSSENGICSNFTCPDLNLMYRCSNNRCIYKRWMCDGENDCRNGEDELQANCKVENCSANSTHCPGSHRCIPNSWLCDYDNDCGDNFDEKNCTYDKCRGDQFTCRNQRCISKDYQCDGDNDCRDNSDEDHCIAPVKCDASKNNDSNTLYFQCLVTGKCIDKLYQCDREYNCCEDLDNCNDYSDETNCTDIELQTCQPSHQFTCYNGLCIHLTLKCDGDNDCGDNSDEYGCDLSNFTCKESEHSCGSGRPRCIPLGWVCDGEPDCDDGSDENCPHKVVCDYPNWLCSNNATCLTPDKLCDDKRDCLDGADEAGLCGLHDMCSSIGARRCQHNCTKSPDPPGFRCTCPALQKLDSDRLTCIDAFPCKFGTCSQECTEFGKYHVCGCLEGFELDRDRFTCKPIGGEATYIIFSNRHEIRRLENASYVSLVSGLRNTIALDFYYNHENKGEGSLIFWTDVVDDKIYKGTMISNTVTNIEVVVNVGLATAEGLAIDWVTEHVYWVESNLDQIEVANFDGSQRLTLIAGDMESPRAVVVDPRKGLIFWTDWDSNFPRIERCSMAGNSRTILYNVSSVERGGWPNGLTLDYQADRLYWIDARSDSIHTIDYNGNDHQEVLRGHEFLSHPFAISVFGNYVYWTDWRTNSLVKANKWNGTDLHVIQRTLTQPFDLHVFHSQRQPKLSNNPCRVNNGGCSGSAVCLLDTGAKPRCLCPHLYKLAADNKTCTLYGEFLLFAKKQEIRGVMLTNNFFNVIPAMTVPYVRNPLSIDFTTGPEGDKVYWSDNDQVHHQHGINSAFLNGTQFATIIDSGIENPSGLAVDWLSGNMYFTSYSRTSASISVSQLNGAYRTVIIDHWEHTSQGSSIRLKKPNSIAVHPTKGMMFWSDLGDNAIYSANMDGSDAKKLFSATNEIEMKGPSSLTVDYDTNTLWWVNTESKKDFIVTCDLDGRNPRSLLTNSTLWTKVPSLTVYKGKVYFASTNATDSMLKPLHRVLTQTYVVNTSGTGFTAMRSDTQMITALKVFVRDRIKEGKNQCSDDNGGCSQLCLPRADSRVCRCTAGYSLAAETACKGVDLFLMYTNRTEINGISIDPTDTLLQALPPISQITSAVGLDFNAADNYIYWVDSQQRTISRIKRDLTQRETLVEKGLFGVEGIAVDWIAGNMYWTDNGRDVIEVAQLNGKNRYVVVHDNMDKPRNIAVDPIGGWMYWTDWGINPRVERARLDGTDRSIFINMTQGSHPFGLAIDYDIHGQASSLYVCDQTQNTIERINIRTEARKIIVTSTVDCMALDVYGPHVYWTDVREQGQDEDNITSSKDLGSINMADKLNGSNVQILRKNLGRNIRALKIYTAERQNNTNNPCNTHNGGCKELCLYNPERDDKVDGHCMCAHGKVYGKTECKDYDAFLAYSKVTGIETVHMFQDIPNMNISDVKENPNQPRKPIENQKQMKNVIGLTFDYHTRRYFYSDIQRGDIQAVHFNGSNFQVLVKNVGSAEGLAYEPVFNRLYWTSYTNSSISSVSLGREPPLGDGDKIIQLEPDDHPRAIVLDSCAFKMYWTNWNDREASIMSSSFAGNGIKRIVTSDIKTPNGLTIDFEAHKLYWSDAGLDKIERCDVDGTNRMVVVSGYPQHVFGLAVYGNYLYWTDWLLRGVIRANKYTGRDVGYLRKNIPRQPMGIVAVAVDTNECLKNPCSFGNGGCEHSCRPIVQENVTKSVVCSCPEGQVLNPDKRTCASANDSCPVGQAHCANGGCIDIEVFCNGISNCINGTDEGAFCENRLCPKDYFHCSNGQCIRDRKHCDKRVDCIDGSDEEFCGCQEHEFQCRDSTICIQDMYRCDHDKDCPDASDEMGCNATDCGYLGISNSDAATLIRCNNTSPCILSTWICDGSNDCWDNEDERNCTAPGPALPCDDNWVQCKDSTNCIPVSWQCDGDVDCPKGTDEQGCDSSCPDDQFQCDTMTCIPRSWVCDRHPDCEDKMDESNCTGSQICEDDEFHCSNSTGNCIPKVWLCDGDEDCAHGEDENQPAGCDPVACDSDEFQCNNYRCIRQSFYCDGDDDCGDNSDEPSSCPEKAECNKYTEFQCRHIQQCISLKNKCDGRIDCWDHTDESNDTCAAPCGQKGKWRCENEICINATDVCNGHNDCGDSSDETRCNINECEDLWMSRQCQHGCEDLKTGFKCTCKAGYELREDGFTCKDVDECEEIYPCTHYCYNTDGSFRCSCAEGYILEDNKHSCKPNTTEHPTLLVSNRYYIRNITLKGEYMELLAMHLNNAVALDFDYQEDKIYWSDVTNGGSTISSMTLDGSNKTVLHNTTLRNPDGIAVDWLGRNLYWCDKTTDTIEVSKLNGRYRKVLVREGLQEPRAIAVHPYRGWLFYTDWGDNAHVGRLGMDGTQRSQVITENLGWPNALTIDYITDRIIWADARLDFIAMANLDGKNMRYIVKENLPHIFALSVFADYIYWTDWEYKSIERANKINGSDRTNITHTIHRPMDIQVYHRYRQMPSLKRGQQNPCANNGNCREGALCLIRPGGQDHVCACPERHYQSTNKTTCIANCTSSEFLCAKSFKCIPFWWRCDNQTDCDDGSDEAGTCPPYHCKQHGLFQCRNASNSLHCISPTQICDGIPQCTDKSDELNCVAHTCLESQFKCQNPPKCVPIAQRCNGNKDCTDGSDEKDCPAQTCAPNQFQCTNKRCIPYVWRCDNDNDCGDNSDEPADCKSVTCRPGYIQCKSGRCLPESWKCDGDRDCGVTDNSDEPASCATTQCDPTYFKCNNTRCIPGRWRCDYDDDCRDGSDERDCTLRACTESEFQCNNGRCISTRYKCDGHNQCADGSDEDLEECKNKNCSLHNQFQCSDSGYCIPQKWRCDGEVDCRDQSDELHCSNTMMCPSWSVECDGFADCTDGSDEKDCGSKYCRAGRFRCHEEDICIPGNEMCDGFQDCKDGSDEENCVKRCGEGQFMCQESGQCIPDIYVCNGKEDCVDKTDESAKVCYGYTQCTSEVDCHRVSGYRNSTCVVNAPGGPRCECAPGYFNNSFTCEDINECDMFGYCPQRCKNHKASYSCHCDTDYQMSNVTIPTGLSNAPLCKAKGADPAYLLVGVENQLHLTTVSLFGNYTQLDITNQDDSAALRIKSMAYHLADNQTYLVFIADSDGSIVTYPVVKDDLNAVKRKFVRVSRHRRENQAQYRTKNLNITNLSAPRSVTVDWATQRLYWAEGGTAGKIASSDFQGHHKKTIIAVNISEPGAVAVDPESRRLFWTTWGQNAKIESSNLDGSNRTILASKHVLWPTSIVVDYPARRIYWTDTKRRTIETMTVQGQDRQVVHKFTKAASGGDYYPYKVDVFESELYVTMYQTGNMEHGNNVYRMTKFKPAHWSTQKNMSLLVRGQTKIRDVLILHQFKQKDFTNDPKNNPCGNYSCVEKSFCVNLPRGRKCICEDGFTMKGSGSEARCEREVPTTCSKQDQGFCFHNGTCTYNSLGNKKCKCSQPWRYVGARCEHDLCDGLCQRGDCVEDTNTKNTTKMPKCSCHGDYTGDHCDLYKCYHYCMNGGFCMMSPNHTPFCMCPTGYKGAQCERDKLHACDENRCVKDQSTCVPSGLDYTCLCEQGFTGKYCENCLYDCDNNHQNCKNYTCNTDNIPGAHCVLDSKDQKIPSCFCPGSYRTDTTCSDDEHSENCHEHCVSKCDSYCQNGATCVTVGNDPVCNCPPDWTGTRCDRHIKACKDQQCGNGVCRGDGSCDCYLGYKGERCETKLGCTSDTCKNRGECDEIGKDSFHCSCAHGWMAKDCSEPMPHSCMAHCLNDGTCSDCHLERDNIYTCLKCMCKRGAFGDRCNSTVPPSSPQTSANLTIIVVPILLVVMVLVAIALFVIYRKRHTWWSQFKHRRMADNTNVEITNPIYMKDYDDDETAEGFSFDGDRPTNFSNPMYESLYEGSGPDNEKNKLLKEDKSSKLQFYDEDAQEEDPFT